MKPVVIPFLIGLAIATLCDVPTAAETKLEREPELLLVDVRPVGSIPDARPIWLAIRGERIVAMGKDDAPRASRVIRLGGRPIAPAMVDHHVHLLNTGLSLWNREHEQPLYLELGGLISPQAVAAALAARAAQMPPDSWVLGKGWSQGNWGSGELPERRELDAAVPSQPVFLSRVDGHAGWVNGPALTQAGLLTGGSDPAGGAVRRRPNGEPAGVLMERANEPVLSRIPKPDPKVIRAALRRGAEALARQGVSDVFDAGFLTPPGVVNLQEDLQSILNLLVEEDRRAPLPLRIHLMIPAPSALAEAVIAAPQLYRRLSPRVRVTHLKLFTDGALGSRGGLLTEPYSDDPATHGVSRMSAEEVRRWAARAIDAEFDVATHAIGDAAVERTLDVYESLLAARPGLEPKRLRVEHFSVARASDFERAARLGVLLSIQPNFVWPDDRGRAMEDARLGERSERAYAWGRLLALGARLAVGSDYFTFPFPPLMTMHSAVTRANSDGLPAEGWHPQERLERGAAWRLMTTLQDMGGGAHPRQIAVGEPADLVVLSADPLTVPTSEILGIDVEVTILGGEIVWQTEESATSP